jgi:hypothetical protein
MKDKRRTTSDEVTFSSAQLPGFDRLSLRVEP